jgi:parallel beta-helix repeat protein
MKKLPVERLFQLCFLFTSLSLTAQDTEVSLRSGELITRSIKVKRAVYYLNGPDSLLPAIVIKGDNITVDFNGSTLCGNKDPLSPDRFTGIGVLVSEGHNIIIKNAVIKGYKVGIMAKRTDALEINGCDLSYNYRQRLKSGRLKEDLSDWMSYHHNENDEWLRFGAGIYLDSCTNALVYDNTITNGQCGLMMTCSDNGRIYNNNFSFNSAVGIGMYRSNYNQVMHNKVDWNVRGYSYGYYYRGQDSGGILVFTQCSNNVFAHNSVTHSGDGFFLWAGQETIDTGIGGCNDNLVYGNDFSYAPTNAVEITFSRNKVIKNKLHGSWHGIWGGFSYNTVIVKNSFGGNLAAISIEHGQHNIIEQNSFTADSMGIELWAIPNRRADFGLMNHKDTRSHSYHVNGNIFTNVPVVYSIKNTQGVRLSNNIATGYRELEKTDTLVTGIEHTHAKPVYDYRPDSIYVASLLAGIPGKDVFLPATHPQGKESILMTEWGPYNFKYPLIWWTKTDKDGRMYFDIKGPSGKWIVKKIAGGKLVSRTADQLQVQRQRGKTPLNIQLEFAGSAFTTPFGEPIATGTPYVFSYNDYSIPMDWQVKWFHLTEQSDPLRNPAAFASLMKDSSPIKTLRVNADEFDRKQGSMRELPRSRFITEINSVIDVPKGSYRLDISAGELVRVYIDNKLVIDAWTRNAIKYDADWHHESMLQLKGKHHIRILKVQYGGYGMLNCRLQKMN